MEHNKPDLPYNLIDIIDDERNDIFIHIEKKADIDAFRGISTKKSNLYFTKQRIDTILSDLLQVWTEMLLFEETMAKSDYKYVHLL